MEEHYYYSRGNVPEFGSWDWNTDLPFTQCFETARQAGLLRYSTYSDDHDQERDLYVAAGDLYETHRLAPAAMIVVPRRRRKGRERSHIVEAEKMQQNWMVNETKLPPTPPPSVSFRHAPKPVDEDLYSISPELLYPKSKKKRGFGFFSSCLIPTCAV